jgi:uncharacterized RDD family membrane protein YckC
MAANTGNLASKKAETVPRVIASVIDGLIIGIIAGIVGQILGMIYWRFALVGQLLVAGGLLLRDIALDGQSPGKKAMKLKAVNAKTGATITQQDSINRNLIFGASAALGALWYLPLGGILGPLGSLAALAGGLWELWTWYNDKDGRRWGDQHAGTIVVSLEAKEAEVEEEVSP